MNAISIKPVKSVFIGIVAIMALLAGGSQGVATTFPVEPFPPFPGQVCEQAFDGITLKIEAGPNIADVDSNGFPTAFLPGQADKSFREVRCPNDAEDTLNCRAWDIRFTMFETGDPTKQIKLTSASTNITSNRRIEAVSSGAKVIENILVPPGGKPSQTFERVQVTFPKPTTGNIITGTVITDKAAPALITANANRRKDKRFCPLQGAGISKEITTLTVTASCSRMDDRCIGNFCPATVCTTTDDAGQCASAEFLPWDAGSDNPPASGIDPAIIVGRSVLGPGTACDARLNLASFLETGETQTLVAVPNGESDSAVFCYDLNNFKGGVKCDPFPRTPPTDPNEPPDPPFDPSGDLFGCTYFCNNADTSGTCGETGTDYGCFHSEAELNKLFFNPNRPLLADGETCGEDSQCASLGCSALPPDTLVGICLISDDAACTENADCAFEKCVASICQP